MSTVFSGFSAILFIEARQHSKEAVSVNENVRNMIHLMRPTLSRFVRFFAALTEFHCLTSQLPVPLEFHGLPRYNKCVPIELRRA